MKTLSILPIALTALLVSCGGGGGDSSQLQPPNDQGELVIPVNPTTEVPVTPTTPETPVPPVVTNPIPQLGALSELIGNVGVAYSFTDTVPIFTVVVEFSADDFSQGETDNGLLLASGVTFVRLSPGDSLLQGRDMVFGCSVPVGLDVFTCVLDAGGENQSFFLFDRLDNGSSQGLFEFCSGASTEICSAGIQSSPDGTALIIVGSPKAASSISSKAELEKTDLLPYLQYLKQGSLEGALPDESSRTNGPIMDAITILKRAIAER